MSEEQTSRSRWKTRWQDITRIWPDIRRDILRFPTTVVVLAVILLMMIPLITSGYGQSWTGFGKPLEPLIDDSYQSKTLWDWLDLLIVPSILAFFAALTKWWLDKAEEKRNVRDQEFKDYLARRDREFEKNLVERTHTIEADRVREAALQSYLDKMTTLLFKEDLRGETANPVAEDVARIRTLTILRRLDGARKGMLLRFLYEARLIMKRISDPDVGYIRPIVKLELADLRGADLRGADLSGAYLRETILSGAYMMHATLVATDLKRADLSKVHFEDAILLDADINEVDLSGADMRRASIKKNQLVRAKSLKGTILDDGTHYDGRFRLKGDLEEARMQGFDTGNAEEMARFYDVLPEVYHYGQEWARENLPELLG